MSASQAGEADGSSAAAAEHLHLHVWPLLGIKPDVADALMAWVHFRQARRSASVTPPFTRVCGVTLVSFGYCLKLSKARRSHLHPDLLQCSWQ